MLRSSNDDDNVNDNFGFSVFSSRWQLTSASSLTSNSAIANRFMNFCNLGYYTIYNGIDKFSPHLYNVFGKYFVSS